MEQPFDESVVRRQLRRLSPEKRLAFLLSCAERLAPNYMVFVEHHGWGQGLALRRSLQLGWDHLFGTKVSVAEVKELLEACEAAAPDTECFDSALVSPALDAANCCLLVLESLLEDDVEKAVEGSALANDTVDMYIREIDSLQPQDPSITEKVNRHPLMQQELARQRQDIEMLARMHPSRDAMDQLANHWRNPRTSNIGLTSS